MATDLISVIMPVYNAGQWVGEAIASVVGQTYAHWELLVINDGSTDDSEAIIKSVKDRRIRYFYQPNSGVSAARNVGLREMQGDYFCFLDADDQLAPRSMEARLGVFAKDSPVTFADGRVENIKEGKVTSTYRPSFNGNPARELAMLSESCFFGITWMIRRDRNKKYRFKTDLSHAEDIIFYLDHCNPSDRYAFTHETIYLRNIHAGSAMTNINSLENSYIRFYNYVKECRLLNEGELTALKRKIRRIMTRSYLRHLKLVAAYKINVRKF